MVQTIIKTEAASIVDQHQQWCTGTTTQHYQMTSPPSLFSGQALPLTAAQTDGQEPFALDPAAVAAVEQSVAAENHLNSDGVADAEQHGVWQQL